MVSNPHANCLTADQFPTLAYLDRVAAHDGYALARLAGDPVDGCRACQAARSGHGVRRNEAGPHEWIEPGTWLRKLRMLARRRLAESLTRYRAEHAEMVAEIASWDAMEAAAPTRPAREVDESYEVLDHGRWLPVRYREGAELCGRPVVWLGLDAGLARAWPQDELIPARRRPTT